MYDIIMKRGSMYCSSVWEQCRCAPVQARARLEEGDDVLEVGQLQKFRLALRHQRERQPQQHMRALLLQQSCQVWMPQPPSVHYDPVA